MSSKRKKPKPPKPLLPRPADPPSRDPAGARSLPRAPAVLLEDHSSTAKIICIFGRRGTGKTYLAHKLISGKRRVLVFDPLGQFKGEREFRTIPELARHCLENRLREDKVKPFALIYRPRQARAEFPFIARVACEVGALCLLAEEISWAISPARMDPAIENLIRYGRHQDVELIGISRRPAEVNRDLTANANEIYIFRTHEPRDIAYFREILGSSVADSLPALAKFTPYVWSDDVQGKP